MIGELDFHMIKKNDGPRVDIAFKIKILGALSVGDGQKRPIPYLLPSQNHYLESYNTPVKEGKPENFGRSRDQFRPKR